MSLVRAYPLTHYKSTHIIKACFGRIIIKGYDLVQKKGFGQHDCT
jgi:hypothetical protein